MAGAASQAGDADSSRAPGLTSGLQGSVNVHRGALLLGPQWRCISSFVFYIFSHLFPLPCGAGSTGTREGFDPSVSLPFSDVLWLWHFLYSVGPHQVSSLHIYTFVVFRAIMAGGASQAGDTDYSQAPGLTSGLQRSVNNHCGALLLEPQWRCISSFVFYTIVIVPQTGIRVLRYCFHTNLGRLVDRYASLLSLHQSRSCDDWWNNVLHYSLNINLGHVTIGGTMCFIILLTSI